MLASLPRPSLPTPTTVAVVSDPHLAPDARGTWKVLHRAPGRFRAALTDADRRGVDTVLSPGDLTRTEEAYVSAREGSAHGRAVAASTAPSGVVDDLLLAAEPCLPPSAYRLDADGRRPGRADADGGAP